MHNCRSTGIWPLVVATALAFVTVALPLAAQTASGQYRPAIPWGLDLYLPVPEENPMTPAKVSLGRKLFFDSILSQDGSLSCSSCHIPERSFTDGRPTSVGVFGRRGSRNVPTIINRAYGQTHFWDGRASTLEDQVVLPIQNPKELDLRLEDAVARLRERTDYGGLFWAAFGTQPNAENLAGALASYLRTVLSGDSPLDRYRNGDDDALSQLQRNGLRIFRRKGNCTTCHLGPTFTDERFHNTGVAWRDGMLSDSGRYVVSGREEHLGAFKTPTLREVALTAPYMHDGSLATLEEVIEFYDRGGNGNPYLDPEIRPLGLTADEKEALLAFLRELSGEVREGMSRSKDSP